MVYLGLVWLRIWLILQELVFSLEFFAHLGETRREFRGILNYGEEGVRIS